MLVHFFLTAAFQICILSPLTWFWLSILKLFLGFHLRLFFHISDSRLRECDTRSKCFTKAMVRTALKDKSTSEGSVQASVSLLVFFSSSFFFFLRIFILLFFIPGCLHVPRHTFTPCGTGFWNWILGLFLKTNKQTNRKKTKTKTKKKQSRGQINTDDFTTPTYIFCLFDWDCSGRPSVTTTTMTTTTTTTCQIIIRLIEWREVGEVELFKHSSQLNKSSEGHCRVLSCDANVCFSKYAALTETHGYYSLWGSHVSRHQRIVKFSSTFFSFPRQKKKVVDFCLLNNLLRLIFIKGGGMQYCKTDPIPSTHRASIAHTDTIRIFFNINRN